jgi:hypothetical protein
MILEISFVVSFVAWLFFERFVNALSGLLYRLVSRESGGGELKQYASMQLCGALASIFAFAFWALAVALLFSALFVLQTYYPDVLLQLVSYWNDPIGPVLYAVFVTPLEILNVILIPAVGLYNLFVWIIVQLWSNLVLAEVIKDFELFKNIGVGVADLLRHLTLETVAYVRTLSETCPIEKGDACYSAGGRMFDFITPMNDLREMSTSVITIGYNMCAAVNGPLEIAVYPLLDINFAKGIHNLLNGALFTVLHVPVVTMLRCTRNPNDVVMCLPDFDPSFNLVSSK